MGRPVLYAKEIKAMNMAERVVMAYRAAADSDNYPEWQRRNPDEVKLFTYAQRIVEAEDGESDDNN